MFQFKWCYIFCVIGLMIDVRSVKADENVDDLSFPDGFEFGTATSSYQVEGAWNVSDKGENVWDRFTHNKLNAIKDGSNGDIACDSYHKFKDDVKLIKELGLNFYRFSMSWSRILPTGKATTVSEDGLRYYHEVLDELEKNKIKPLVTLYHWDHPQIFEDDFGGWPNELMVDLFAEYARVVFREFGDRVKMFATFNEPSHFCYEAYNFGMWAPGLNLGKRGEYLCSHNILKAHAKAYRIYDKEFRERQGGRIGFVMNCEYFYPKYSNDSTSVEIAFQYNCGRILTPIFSKTGDYPQVVKERVAANSKYEGLPTSRLPNFSKDWIDIIKGSADFLGLNHYTSKRVAPAPQPNDTIYFKDHGLDVEFDPGWNKTPVPFIRTVPEGLKDILVRIKKEYGDVPIYITENGIGDTGTLQDYQRMEFLYSYMKSLLSAIKEHGCNVKGYTVWSLLDNFEWSFGYSLKFGLYNVDFTHPNRTRTPKASVAWLKSVFKNRKLEPIDVFLPVEDKQH